MKTNKMSPIHYSAISGAFILVGIPAIDAQIVYNDYDPDIVLDPEGPVSEALSFDMDVNSDGSTDFFLRGSYLYFSTGWASELTPLNHMFIEPVNKGQIQESDSGDFSAPVNVYSIGALLNTTARFINEDMNGFGQLASIVPGTDTAAGYGYIDEWVDTHYKYASFRLKVAGNYRYGWMRLSVGEEGTSVTLHDLAYNNTINEPIIAGETGICNEPIIYSVFEINSTSAKISWAPVLNTSKYQIKYRPAGGAWTTVNVSGSATTKRITGLSCAQEYEVKISAKCVGSFSEFSPLVDFTTASCKLYSDETEIIPVNIYPNPASDNITINVNTFNDEEVRI